MALNLSNLIVPAKFAGYVSADLAKLNRVVRSGAAVVSPQLSTLLAGGASTFNLPFWSSISHTGLVPSTDVASTATPQRMAAAKQIAVRIQRSVTPVSLADLEGSLIGEDPVGEAVAQYVVAHDTIRQQALLSMLTAIAGVDSSDAGTAADLTYDAGTGAFSAVMALTGIQAVWGDRVRLADTTIFLNSLDYLSIQKDELNSTVASKSAIDVGFGTFLGATLIVEDDVTAGNIYLVRRGGLAFGSASVATPFELERQASAGNGGGATLVHSRDLFSYHVGGTSFTGSIAGELATNAEIGTTGNWSLAKDKKFCGVMRIIRA